MALPFLDSTVDLTLSGIKDKLVALCQANGLPVTSWVDGDPTERWLDITPRLVFAVLGGIVGAAFRGFFLDFATDPGDPGDTSEDQTPRAGFLSALGAGWYSTFRRKATFATTTLVLQNNGTGSATFNPFDLTFTTKSPEPVKADGGRPTYRNTTPGATVLAPAATVTLTVIAEQIGSYGTAGANSLTCVTQSFGTLAVTSSAAATGQDREDAGSYRARCRLAPDSKSPGGPTGAYLYAMNTAGDGEPLQRYDGSGPVTINTAYVSPASATGLVTMYVAGPSGAVDQVDVDSANANIVGLPLGVITAPLGVLPDTATIGPTVYTGSPPLDHFPNGTGGCASATNTTIAVTYTVQASAKRSGLPVGTYTTGGGPPAAVGNVFALISAALSADILGAGIGGNNQTSGAGFVYTEDLEADIKGAAPGLSNPSVTVPAGASTAIALGHIGVLGTVTGTLTVVSP
jgi:hypothetical protein